MPRAVARPIVNPPQPYWQSCQSKWRTSAFAILPNRLGLFPASLTKNLPPMLRDRSLADVPQGHTARIDGIDSAASPQLAAAGLQPGALVEVVESGACCRIRIDQREVTLPGDAARHVWVSAGLVDEALPLSRLAVGQQAEVLEVSGDDAIGVRLMEMGLVAGIGVQVVGAAPLGDPLELEVCGYHLSVRKAEAERVLVRPQLVS